MKQHSRIYIPIIFGLILALSSNAGWTQEEDKASKPQLRTKSLSSEARSDAAVQSVVQKHRKLFNYYYQRVWRYNQKARGSIKIRVTIQKDGRVRNVEVVNDSVKIRSLTRFIIKHARQWEFDPEKTAGSTVDLIFPFAPA